MVSSKRGQSITILPADKGGATVVLDHDAYIQKATWTRPNSAATQSHLSNHTLGLL